MRILHVASEIFPLVKTGGLADVLGSLPPALARRGLDVRVLLPGFPGVLDGIAGLRPITRIGPVFGAASVTLCAGRLPDSDLLAYVIDAPFLFRREGNPYSGPDGHDWNDNHRRFGLLCWTAAHLASGELDPGWVPSLVHAHDWHTGLTPVYLMQNPSLRIPTVFTIHNLAFRGIFPMDCHYDLDLPTRQMSPRGLEFHGNLSFMKAGLVYASRITTVSPNYAREICTPEFGCGLDGVIQDRAGELSGILNGVDYTVWNPDDEKIARPYSVDDLAGKTVCKQALLSEFGLSTTARGPLFAVVSRLTSQKGMDLLLAALPELLQEDAQLVVLGTGDGDLEAGFRYAAAVNPDKVAVHVGYDEAMSHRFMAGADILVVPSRFEPCGLTQLYALRYGTLPLVRWVGGLADTVVDVNYEDRATGFVFGDASRQALGARIREACQFYCNNKSGWVKIQRRAMRQDFSWDGSAANYEQLYRNLS
ncbi:MAG: glycogen synthase GlgA [Candidatus Accumulibacter sp.]|jgi:starch synthase|nr:glycogen synthase GlgA [Accumulibacter sp.]